MSREPKPRRLIFATPGNGGPRDFFEGFTEQFVLSRVHGQVTEGYDSDKMLFAIQYRQTANLPGFHHAHCFLNFLILEAISDLFDMISATLVFEGLRPLAVALTV